MAIGRFVAFNIAGACLWAGLVLGLGTLAGQIPWVRDHFALVTLLIIAASLVPLALQWHQARQKP
jgi:membrane-associated protein